MKSTLSKSMSCLFLIVAIIVMSLLPCFAAQTTTGSQQLSSVLQNELYCVSKYGNTADYPENSAEAILSAADKGADMVMVSVKKTSDNNIVIMKDDNLSRMCVDSLGNTVNKNISDVGYFELSSYHLRNSTGLLHEKITEYTVPTLQQVIEKLNGKCKLVIDDGWEYRDDIYNLLVEMNMLDSAIIVADGNKKEVSQWLSNKSSMPLVFSKYTGNVIWNSSAYIKKTTSAGVVGVMLGDNNSHSTSFSVSTVDKLNGKARAVVDMTDPQLCGQRTDNYQGWDEITSRGFSIVITNNIEEFNEYKQRVSRQKDNLNKLIMKESDTNYTLCSTKSANMLKESVFQAKEIAANSVSAMELENTYNSLYNAFEGLSDRTENDKEGTTITKGRVIAAVCVIIGLIALELCFEYFRRKKIADRKKGKNRAKSKSRRDDINNFDDLDI